MTAMSDLSSKEMLAELVAEHARAWRDWAYAHSSQTYDPGTKYKEEEAEEVSKQLIAAFDARQPVETSGNAPELTSQERHALWNATEAARDGFVWTDPTGRKLLRDLYNRTAGNGSGDA